MLRKLQGRVVCLAPAGEHGAADGLGNAFAEAGLVTPEEQQASEALAAEEADQDTPDAESVEDPKAEETPAADAEASGEVAPEEGQESLQDLQAKVTEANAKISELNGQVAILTGMNAALNKEKAELQASLDKVTGEAQANVEAADSLKPLAKRQIKTIALTLNERVSDEELQDMSAVDLASKGATMLDRMKGALPSGQQSATAEDESQTTEKASVTTAHDAGLGNL